MIKHLTISVILLISLSVHSYAQQNQHRPKIGLALSGGGAKGFFHVGILQALDSAGLKVDYITGTSMGSVVGGLYAAGYSGDSIEAITKTLDWNLLFSTAPQLEAISIEEKSEYNKYALEIPFSNGKFKLGTGIIEGQELWLKFAELFHPVYNITDFNKLSIPFMCIATDLSTGDAVKMTSGNLKECIRASMAIPTIFTPVIRDGKTLVDGGIVTNFPVLEVKEMGADIIIGVNLNKGLDKAEDLTTMFDVLLQLAFFKDAMMFETHKAECDIYMLPELRGYSTGDFAASDSIINIGKEYGAQFYPVFKHLADSLNAIYPSEPFVKNRLPVSNEITVNSYEVNGLQATTSRFFKGLAGLKDNSVCTDQMLAESIRKAYGSRYYKKINYDFVPVDSLRTNVKFDIQENPLTAVKFGINYNSFTKLGLIANITTRDLLLKESRALATVSISENPRLYAEYFKYLGMKRKLGFNLSYFTEHLDYPVYKDFREYETFRANNSYFDARLQYAVSRNAYAGLSQRYSISNLKTIESPLLELKTKNKYLQSFMSVYLNNADKRYFATKGWIILFEGGYVYSQDMEAEYNDIKSNSLNYDSGDYGKFLLSAEHFNSFNSKWVLQKKLFSGILTTDDPYPTNAFQVGGIGENILNQSEFTGLNDAEIKSNSITSLMLGLQYQLSKSLFVTATANAALYDFMHVRNELSSDNFLSGYGLGLGFNSVLGPIHITTMYCDQDGKVRTNLNIGYRFLRE